MKKILTLVVAALILTSACKKEETEEPSVKGTWTLGATTYKMAFSAKTTTSGGDHLYIFADALPNNPQVNTLNLSFKTAPTATGTYELISAGTTKTTDKHLHIAAGGPAGTYAYLGSALSVTITLKDGKVVLNLPEIAVKSTGTLPELKLSASISEM